MSTRLGGRYQLVRELGAGGMGRVFQAVDTETGRAVAAKIMLATSEDNLDALLRFQQEGAVLSTLKHPNIVEVYGTFLEEHTSCIIMELLEGQSLSQILRAERLSLPRVKSLAAQTASALAYAHGRAIVHRDVKPDNIMVVGDDHVKVTDFGIARILRTGATLNTAAGMSIGTPLYMAPEQIEGQKVDGRADIYSFGAVLYQMVTGQPPFEGDDPLTIAFKHVHKEPRKPKELAADIPDDWEAVIMKCLAKDPGERFQTATALHEAIQALSAGDGSVAASTAAPAPVPTSPPTPAPYKPDTIDRIINPEVTGGNQAGPPLGPAATVLGMPGETALGPVDGAHTVNGPMDNATGAIPGAGQTVIGGMDGRATGATVSQSAPTPTQAAWQPSPTMAPPPVVGPSPAVAGATSQQRRPAGLIAAGALIAVLVLGGGGFVAKNALGGGGNASPTATVLGAPSVAVSGHKSGGAYVSGSTVTIKLAGSSADAYRVKVAKNSQFVKASTYTTVGKTQAISVLGAETYYVRSQGKSGGKWGPWSSPVHFSVARPVIGATHFATPTNGFTTTNTSIHLSWAPVKNAASYKLIVDGHGKTVRVTSTTVRATVGTHHVSVAAQMLGSALYTGPTTKLTFTVKAKPRPTSVTASTPAVAPAPTSPPAAAPYNTSAPNPPTAAPYNTSAPNPCGVSC